ncbi:MAG: hypothetical protein WDN04_06510 [Rhodospirillales bacterium]
MVQAVLASFIENKAGDNRDEIDRATIFLDAQIANYERQLRDAEQRRAAFKKKYVDLLPGDSGGQPAGGRTHAAQVLTGSWRTPRSAAR